jgi:20S proteasome alpha/beta subunit
MASDGPALFHMDPSGTYVRFEAKAIGSASEGAQSALQDEYNKVAHFPPCVRLESVRNLKDAISFYPEYA